MKITKRHHDAALKFANNVRALLGKKPVKRLKPGRRNSAASCTIARTIDANGAALIAPLEPGAEALISGRARPIKLRGESVCTKSKLVQDFIEAFDEGEIPELDERQVAA